MTTSMGCEKEIAANKALFKKDTVGYLNVNYYSFIETEDKKGSFVIHVNSCNPNGSLPEMLTRKMAVA